MKKLLLSILLFIPVFVCGQINSTNAVALEVDSLLQTADALMTEKNYDAAMPVLESATSLARENFGSEHPLYADCLFQQGRIFHTTRKPEDAERLYLEVMTIREKALGNDHLDYAAVLRNLGLLYYGQGRYPDAEPLYAEVRTIREKALGKDHLEYASILNSMAMLYKRANRLDEALQLELEVKDIREKKLGKDHPSYINILNNIGSTYYLSGYFEPAEEHWLQVKSWREKNLGTQHPHYLGTMFNLANLNTDIGRYEEAARIYTSVKTAYEENLETENADYAFTLTFLGDLCRNMGRYEEAEAYLLKAKAIQERLLGAEHPEYAVTIDMLASLYFTLGLYDAAEPLYLETKAIREKQLGTDHPDYAVVLNNLAALNKNMNRQDTAEAMYLEVKTALEHQQKKTADYAWVLNNLAIVYTDKGQYEWAETFLNEARSIREDVLGKDHPDYANTLEDLAILYLKMEKPGDALTCQQEAVAIFEKTLGEQHLRYARNLNNLATIYNRLGQNEQAASLSIQSNTLYRNLLTKAALHLSERELAAYADLFENDLNNLFSLAHQKTADTDLGAACYNNILFYKGFLLMAANRMKQLARSDTKAAEHLEILASCQRRIAAEYVKPRSERSSVDELEAKANEVEKKLVRTVAGFGDVLKQVTWQEIRDHLKPGEAAIEFIHYPLAQENGDFYSALVLQSGDAAPALIPLCNERSFGLLFNDVAERRLDYVVDMYTYQGRGASPVDEDGVSLYELLWQPLEETLKAAHTVYFSPSGLLHRLNVGAIPLNEEETLADRFKLVLVGSTRQIVMPSETNHKNQEFLLLGGVNYELDSVAVAERQIPENLLAERGSVTGNSVGRVSRKTSTWTYIKWTEKEVRSLHSIIESAGMVSDVRTGIAATEESFKAIGEQSGSPRVIHLATHGFFFPDPHSAGVKNAHSNPGSPESELVFRLSDQPLIRSGLILAGGNYAWLNGRPFVPGMEDGILTAYEISQVDLSGTELVVLSACETGLGDIRGNEGVYGLQRAFKIAGVKYIIMSLWEVPDLQTKKLMTLFYSKWLEEQLPVRDALYEAQREMREFGFSPFQWAGFVLME